MYFNEMKGSTVTVGYDVGVTNIVKVHAVMTKPPLGTNLTNGIKAFNHMCNKINYSLLCLLPSFKMYLGNR